MDVNLESNRTMKPAYEKRMPATSFLRDTFFGEVETSLTASVDMDFYKNKQITAPFVADGVNSINVGRDKTITKTYTPPLVAPSRIIDSKIIEQRYTGENPYSPISAEERAQRLLERDYNELSDSITRTEEKMVADLLQTGKIQATGFIDDKATTGIVNEIDFGFENTLNLTTADKWNTASSKIKMQTIETAAEVVRSAGYDPTIMILGKDAINALINDTDFMKLYFDISRANLGAIDPQITSISGQGYTLIGVLRTLNIYIYRYDATYYDTATKKVKQYINPSSMIIGPRDIGTMLYGAITLIDDSKNFVTYETTRAPQIVTKQESGIKKLIVKSRPIAKPNDISSWVTAKVMSE